MIISIISTLVATLIVGLGLTTFYRRREKRLEEKLESAESRAQAASDAADSRYAMMEEAYKKRDEKAVEAAEKTELLAIAERKNREYFNLIESVVAQRNEWTTMFREHSIEHQRAQALLEGGIIRMREYLLRTIKIVNDYRTKNGEPRLNSPFNGLNDEPVGTAEKFGQKMKALEEHATPPIHAIAERDRIHGG